MRVEPRLNKKIRIQQDYIKELQAELEDIYDDPDHSISENEALKVDISIAEHDLQSLIAKRDKIKREIAMCKRHIKAVKEHLKTLDEKLNKTDFRLSKLRLMHYEEELARLKNEL